MSESGPISQSTTGTSQTFQAIVNAEALQQAVALTHALFDECHVFLNDDGIRLSAIDPATVASIDLTVGSAAFEKFETTGVHIGVDLDRLSNVVGMADRGQLVELILDSETRKLIIHIDTLEYTLALIDPDTIRAPPDHSNDAFELEGTVVIEAADFDRAVQAAEMVSNHIVFRIDDAEDEFTIEATGDTDETSLTLSSDDLVEFTPGEARSLFSLDYLTAINRAMPNDSDVELRLGTEQPVVMQYEFAENTGTVEYLLAPRISSQ